jgi:hypothetical protein
MAGIVDSDKYHGAGNIPFFLKEEFEGLIPKGTPYAQIIPIKRAEWTTVFDPALVGYAVNTGIDGKFAASILLAKPINIRIATDGTWERAESFSNEVAIQIDRTISLSAPGTEKAKVPFQISGTVRPRSAGAVVSLMRYTAGTWKNVATATTDEKGNFLFPNAGEARSIVRYQVIVQADSIWRQVAAPEFSIIIR